MHDLLWHTHLYLCPSSSFSPSPKPICNINPNANAKPIPNPNPNPIPIPNPNPKPNPNPNPIPIPTLIIQLILTVIVRLALTLILSLNRNLLIYQSCGLCPKLNATEIFFNPYWINRSIAVSDLRRTVSCECGLFAVLFFPWKSQRPKISCSYSLLCLVDKTVSRT